MKLIFFSKNQIDIQTLLITAKELTGTSPSKDLDKENREIGDLYSYLRIYEELSNNPEEHIFLSFIMIGSEDEIINLSEQRDIIISFNPTLRRGMSFSIASGTLGQWQRFVEFCEDNEISNQVKEALRKEGIYD